MSEDIMTVINDMKWPEEASPTSSADLEAYRKKALHASVAINDPRFFEGLPASFLSDLSKLAERIERSLPAAPVIMSPDELGSEVLDAWAASLGTRRAEGETDGTLRMRLTIKAQAQDLEKRFRP